MEITVEAVTPAHFEALAALFEAAGSPCYCRFWHFGDTNNAWLERCATAGGAENREELRQALGSGSGEARGVVARAGDRLVGWMKVAPREVMGKAYERRFYRNLPCFQGDREGVYLLGCALVHPEFRRKGVATALVEGAVRAAEAWGARALEAMPRRPREAVSDDELWTGPESAFVKNGFVEAEGSAFEAYPVLRRALR